MINICIPGHQYNIKLPDAQLFSLFSGQGQNPGLVFHKDEKTG